MGPRAVAFVASCRPHAALAFYRDVLRLRLVEETPFAIVFDAFGTTLRVQKANEVKPAPFTVFGLALDPEIVGALRAEVGRLNALGIEGVRYPHFDQDELGIWKAPSGIEVFWFHDPDGNLLSLSWL